MSILTKIIIDGKVNFGQLDRPICTGVNSVNMQTGSELKSTCRSSAGGRGCRAHPGTAAVATFMMQQQKEQLPLSAV